MGTASATEIKTDNVTKKMDFGAYYFSCHSVRHVSCKLQGQINSTMTLNGTLTKSSTSTGNMRQTELCCVALNCSVTRAS